MSSRTYIVAEVWGDSGARYAHPNPRSLPNAIQKARELAEMNRNINPRSAATTLEIYELKAVYPVTPERDPENPERLLTEDILDISKPVVFPNV
jgi:hypothetical protein